MAAAKKPIVINGTSGDDSISGSSAAEIISGGAGNDQIFGGGGNDLLYGGAGNDSLFAGAGDDLLDGGDGNDFLYDPDGGANIFRGGKGNDTVITYSFTSAVIDMGDGDDSVTANGGGPVDVQTGAGRDSISLFSVGSFRVDAGAGDDTISVYGNVVGGRVYGGAGNDQIEVFGPGVIVDAGEGNDIIRPGAAAIKPHTIQTGAGSDTIYVPSPDALPVVITDFKAGKSGDLLNFGGMFNVTGWDQLTNPFAAGFLRVQQSGKDTLFQIDFDGNANGHNYQTAAVLQNTTAKSLTSANVAPGWDPTGAPPPPQTIYGTSGDDTIQGGLGNDKLFGLGGNDVIFGGTGHDRLEGGDGDDRLYGDYGNDVLIGGAGNDTLSDDAGNNQFNGGAGDDMISSSGASAVIDAGDGLNNVYVSFAESATVTAGSGNDNISAVYSSHVVIRSGNGNDSIMVTGNGTGVAPHEIYAGGGNDVVLLDARAIVDAGAGNDQIRDDYGIGNANTIITGAGSDTIFLANQRYGALTVTDFASGQNGDILDLTALLSSAQSLPPLLSPFLSGYMRVVQAGQDALVQFDHDGTLNGAAWETQAVLQHVTVGNLTAFNFGGIDPSGTVPSGWLVGTAGADTLTGNASNNTIFGLDGDDMLIGAGGNDIIYGGQGNDTLDGGEANDQLSDNAGSNTFYGRGGNDTIISNGSDSAYVDAGEGTNSVSVDTSGNATVIGGSGADTIDVFSSYTTIDAGDGDNVISASGSGFGYQTFISGSGHDVLHVTGTGSIDTGGGDDEITLNGSFIVNAGGGDDQIRVQGGFPSPQLTLGAGRDVVVIQSQSAEAAHITDFHTAEGDAIDLHSLFFVPPPAVDNVANYVSLQDDGYGGTALVIDQFGSGSYSIPSVYLDGVSGLDVATMFTNGNLIFA